MMPLKKTKNILIGLLFFSILAASCNREATIDRVLFKETKNKIFKDIDEAKLAESIKSTIESGDFKNKDFLIGYYQNNGYQASLLKKFMSKDQLALLADHISKGSEHGMNSNQFGGKTYTTQSHSCV